MKTTNLYVGFDPYFGVTILILAFSVFVYLVFQHQQGRKEPERFAEK